MVRRLQGLLTAAGSPVTIDGDFGPRTESAVKAEQSQAHVAVDGVVGQTTWTKLLGG
jgi:peptidoglycan hydrolase-like protein with peptidoglycan-binding domain